MFTRNGLEILVYDSLSSDEKKVVRGLYKWWIEEGLNLIKESYDISFNNKNIKVTLSIGVSSNTDFETAWEMFDDADKALYNAKNSGRNKTCPAE